MVRRLQPSDLKDILEVWKLLQSDPQFATALPRWSQSQLESEVLHAQGLIFGGERGALGFILFRKIDVGLEIGFLATHPMCRRSGIMSSLLKSLFESLNPTDVLWLEVHEHNLPAQNLYRKLGFKVTGHRSNYYQNGAAAINMEYRHPISMN